MYPLRPGTSLPPGQRSFKHRPEVLPPPLLRIVAALALLSIVGVIVYAVADQLTPLREVRVPLREALPLVGLHFVLPLAIVYTVSTNSGWSRPLIALYTVMLATTMALGAGYWGELPFALPTRLSLALAGAAIVGAWLYGSRKMRLYYALLAGREVPEDLRPHLRRLLVPSSFARRAAAAIDWAADHLETLVLLGFIAVVLAAWVSTFV